MTVECVEESEGSFTAIKDVETGDDVIARVSQVPRLHIENTTGAGSEWEGLLCGES